MGFLQTLQRFQVSSDKLSPFAGAGQGNPTGVARIKRTGSGADPQGVRRRVPLVLCALLAAGATGAGAELYRCEAADGSPYFAGSPHACRGAVRHPLRHRIQRAEAPAPPAAPTGAPVRARDLAPLLLGVAEVRPGWEVVREAPVDPSGDPDLVRWGVSAQRARHYTRDLAGTTEVCSIELWSFATTEQAAAAAAGFSYPGWRIAREGEILLMVRGVRRPPGGAPERGVFAACEVLAERTRARLAAAGRPSRGR
jgi:hypothetical protein